MSVIAKTPVALQLWSLNKLCAEDFFGTMTRVAKMGYDGVEFAGFHNRKAAEVKKVLADNGLRAAGSHTGLQLLRESFEATADYNLEVGNKFVIVPCVGEEVRKSVDTWKALVEEMLGYNEKLKARGLVMGYHNHDFEFAPVGGTTAFDLIFGGTPQDFLMQVDMGWSFRAGVDARGLFQKYPGRSRSVHVKAYSAKLETACIGEDDVAWADVLPAAVETGGAEWFVVEHERHAGDPEANVRKCLDYLRGLQG